MTGCQCEQSGWCERHKVRKTENWFRLCKTRDDYFRAWENGSGPGQKPPSSMPSVKKRAWNLTKSLAQFASDGFRLASKDEYGRRMFICDQCDRRSENWCRECGCNLSVKVRGLAFECPIGRWNKSDYLVDYFDGHDWEFVKTSRLVETAISMIPKIGANISRVAGIPRSGMIPASVLATMLHVPLYEVSEQHGLRKVGNGWRGGQIKDSVEGTTLIVDDTVYNGLSSTPVRRLVPNHLFASVFVRPGREHLADVYGAILPSPHLLEWNLFNSGMTDGHVMNPNFRGGIATDLDGILCEECPIDGDDTPEGDELYRQWVVDARPLVVADFVPIPLIVTHRPERFRPETEAWLAKNRIQYVRLVMDQSGGFNTRNFSSPEHKGTAYLESNCSLFIESDQAQAQQICEFTRRPVLHLSSGTIHQQKP